MAEVDLFLVLVIFVHREIDDPGQFEPFLVDELQILADLCARRAGEFGEFFRVAGDEKSRVAGIQAELGADRLDALRPDIIGERAATADAAGVRIFLQAGLVPGAVEEQDIAQPRLSLALRPAVHAVGEGALAAARRGNAPRLRSLAVSSRRAKILKPEPRKCSDTSCMTSGLRRSGLSEPYLRMASA